MPIKVCGEMIILAEVTVYYGLGRLGSHEKFYTHKDIHVHMPVAGGDHHLCVEVDIPRPWSGYSHPKHCTSSSSGVSHSSVAFPPFGSSRFLAQTYLISR